jgi:hypothetical protein
LHVYTNTQREKLITGLGGPFGLLEVEAPRISVQSTNEDGEVYAPAAFFPSADIYPLVLISVRS